MSADEVLERADTMGDLASRCSNATDSIYLERFELVEKHNLCSLVKWLIDQHIPTCPACGAPFAFEGDELEELIIYGEMKARCECPDRGWDRPDRGGEDLSRFADEMHFLLRGRASDWLPRVECRHAGINRAIEVHKVALSGAPAVRLVFSYYNMYLTPVFMVDLDVCTTIAITSLRAQCEDVWASTKRECWRRLYIDADEKADAGDLLRLSFDWDERRGRMSTRRRIGGKTVVYTVDQSVVGVKVDAGQNYYCTVVATPERAKTPTFELVIVRAVLPGPRQRGPRR